MRRCLLRIKVIQDVKSKTTIAVDPDTGEIYGDCKLNIKWSVDPESEPDRIAITDISLEMATEDFVLDCAQFDSPDGGCVC